jgi:DNA modification methylase
MSYPGEIKSNRDFSSEYRILLEKYKKNDRYLEVDFRKLVNFNSSIDRYTHLIHPYPAKLLANIPYFFINNSNFTTSNSTVLDPFCGSGTVLLESILSGRNAFGADSNPLARLIAGSKVHNLNPEKLRIILSEITKKIPNSTKSDAPQNLLNWDRWYTKATQHKLGVIGNLIRSITSSNEVVSFFNVCLSVTAKKTSFCDPTVSVPVRINPKRFKNIKRRASAESHLKKIENINAYDVFETTCLANISRVEKLFQAKGKGRILGICDDSRSLNIVKDNQVDLIITSPPYAGAQKYIRSSSLSLGWLNLCPDEKLRNLEKLNIGREHYNKHEYISPAFSPSKLAFSTLERVRKKNPLRSHIAANYLLEMQKALRECYRVLKPQGKMILVVGNNLVCGEEFETRKYLEEICMEIGFSTEMILKDEIHSRGLMTKRNKTASVITCEWVIILRK